jgi:peptidoglycan/xylan/chitin deacetylase (PgdA/CDA1 family)
VPVLMYHRVVPSLPGPDPYGNCVTVASFESHLRWLARRGYTGVPLGAVAEALGGARGPLPRRPVVITFDDGYEDNHRHAWPALRRHGFGATVFLVSDAIGGHNHFDAADNPEPVPMLSVEQIRAMHGAGIDFGSHTCTHPGPLTALADDRIRDELTRSRAAIEAILDSPVLDFAYPHSRLDPRVEALVRAAGYRLACAGVGTRFSRHCLHRVAPPLRGGPHLELEMRVRRLKHRIRRSRRRW